MMDVDQRAIVAASNNADLYEAVFSSHGLSYERLPFAFVGRSQPPPYYSNLTVLAPHHTEDIVLQIKALAKQFKGKVGLKDSFCQLDIQANGFDILFGASWIWRDAGAQTVSNTWQRVEGQTDLLLWERAWKKSGSPNGHRMFNKEMLERPGLVFFGRKIAGEFEAGCIANKSADCVGVSNIFSKSSSKATFVEAIAAVAGVAPQMPIVGYESGKNLNYAQGAGFETVGDLRILVANAARF